MAFFSELRRQAQSIVPPFIGVCMVGYFAYHAVQGDRGFLAWLKLTQEIADAQTRLAAVSGEHDALEHRVNLLRPESLDPDMLEERARILLNFVRQDERVILINPKVN